MGRPDTIGERELWACAKKMIDGHGEDAEVRASMRADELLAAGDVDGQRVWKAILARVEACRSDERPARPN